MNVKNYNEYKNNLPLSEDELFEMTNLWSDTTGLKDIVI